MTNDDFLRLSTNPDRSSSGPLNGSTVEGNIYVFVNPSNVSQAIFTLDSDATSEATIERYAPFDYAKTAKDGNAYPFDTKTLPDGQHSISVVAKRKDTEVNVLHTASFTVKNSQALFPGDVAPGYVRWGCSITGGQDPKPRHENVAGTTLGLHRTFFQWSERQQLVDQCQEDLTNNRVPWVSIKPGGSWKEVADGGFYVSFYQLFISLSGLDGPVWFTFHHEPEGGSNDGPDDPGGPSEWLRVQKTIRSYIDEAKATNVAFASILMGWTFQTKSGRNPEDWYADNIWDFAGIDAYVEDNRKTAIAAQPSFVQARKFYGNKKLKLAIAEWGNRTQSLADRDAGKIPTQAQEISAANEMQEFYDHALGSATDGKGAQIIGMSYFDSNLNSERGGWELKGGQLNKFRELMNAPTSLHANA